MVHEVALTEDQIRERVLGKKVWIMKDDGARYSGRCENFEHRGNEFLVKITDTKKRLEDGQIGPDSTCDLVIMPDSSEAAVNRWSKMIILRACLNGDEMWFFD